MKKIIQKIGGYFIIFVSLLLIFSLGKNLLKVSEIGRSIEKERARVEKLKAENERLKREAARVEGGDFIEKQLRDKLGLAKPGEIVLVLPDKDTLRKLAPHIPEEEEALPDPNWKKWLKLFF